jgi:hypothetical protein
MRAPMFVFVGLPDKKEIDYVPDLQSRLNESLNNVVPGLSAVRKEHLFIVRHDNATIYAAVMMSETEMKDWTKMAKDFELTIDRSELSSTSLEARLAKIKKAFPKLYKEVHYDIARVTFDAMKGLSNLKIYAFL